MVRRMKKKLSIHKNIYFIFAGILSLAIIIPFMASGLSPFTTIANTTGNEPPPEGPDEMVLEANIILTSNNKEYIWDMKTQFPDELKEEGFNGTIKVEVEIMDINIDILFIQLNIEGPVSSQHNLTEMSDYIWTYEYDTTELINGVYIFTLEGKIDTSPLYNGMEEGEIFKYKYDAFNVIWENGSGKFGDIYGIPYEYAFVGGVVVFILLFTGSKKDPRDK